MKQIIAIALSLTCLQCEAQTIKKALKFATFYTAFSGGNSLSDDEVFSIDNGLQTGIVKTPFDYSFTAGIRKIARFGYENRANVFYDGTEKSYGDAATVGKVKGFEFLFEGDYRRQQGVNYLDQDHFLRYVGKNWIAKVEFLQDGFADVRYFEGSQRLRLNLGNKLSFNVGAVQRLSEPYGYDPLSEWLLSNNQIHYTFLALEEGYEIDVNSGEFLSPDGEVVANSPEVWEEVVIPQVLDDYVSRKRSELPDQWNYSLVLGFDFYHYTDDFWMHSWGNVMPVHLDSQSEYSYHRFVNDDQWIDYSGGLIFGKRFNRSFGVFLEGKYNKYWDRVWHDFSVGINYVIL
jgi:hypothetical protein|tara:strand:- start:770 stop:1807 length:1038 start_codon:yes stop_codon:yes gene_type:complete